MLSKPFEILDYVYTVKLGGLKALAFSMMVLNIISFLALLVFFIIRFRKVRGAVKSLNQNPEPL
jgi:uncharacterized membrane protein